MSDPQLAAFKAAIADRYVIEDEVGRGARATVYRAGDVVGAQTEGLLGRLGLGLAALASCAVPLAAVWLALGLWLGRAQSRRAPA